MVIKQPKMCTKAIDPQAQENKSRILSVEICDIITNYLFDTNHLFVDSTTKVFILPRSCLHGQCVCYGWDPADIVFKCIYYTV